jgi:hypothetical protein
VPQNNTDDIGVLHGIAEFEPNIAEEMARDLALPCAPPPGLPISLSLLFTVVVLQCCKIVQQLFTIAMAHHEVSTGPW